MRICVYHVLGTEIQIRTVAYCLLIRIPLMKVIPLYPFNGNIILALPYRIQGFESVTTSLQIHNLEELSSWVPDPIPNP